MNPRLNCPMTSMRRKSPYSDRGEGGTMRSYLKHPAMAHCPQPPPHSSNTSNHTFLNTLSSSRSAAASASRREEGGGAKAAAVAVEAILAPRVVMAAWRGTLGGQVYGHLNQFVPERWCGPPVGWSVGKPDPPTVDRAPLSAMTHHQ